MTRSGTAWKQRSTPRKTPGTPNRAAKKEFLTDHTYGYGTRRGQTIEYVVKHPTWRYWNAVKAEFDCTAATLRTLYGEAFAPYLKSPRSAFLVEGSPVIVRRPRVIPGVETVGAGQRRVVVGLVSKP